MSLTTRTLSYTDSTGTTLASYFVCPSNSKPAAGVIVAPEWWGLSAHAKHAAERLAEAGYAALTIDLYGNGLLTDQADIAGEHMNRLLESPQLLAERTDLALAALKQQSETDAQRIGAIGFCLGGKVVLEAARRGLDLKGVASFHGNPSAFKPAQAGSIKGKILFEHGGADSLIPMSAVETFREEMTAAGADFTIDVFADAKHGFTNPQATENGKRNGVDLAYHEQAASQSWQNMLDLFTRVLA